ncbi:MAG: CvpA family protein [Lachnospiraceae bacterium]|nr:CvpA family protein [Lachnospiraceae bacterium]
MNWLLLLVILCFIIGICAGLARGFTKTVYSLIATALIILLTIILCPVMINILKNSEKLSSTIYEKLDSVINLEEAYDKAMTKQAEKSEDKKNAGFSETVDSVLEQYGYPSVMRNAITESEAFKEYAKNYADDFARGKMASLENCVCKTLTTVIISALGFIITFIVVSIVVFIIGKILDVISKLPGLKSLNKLLGGVAGFSEALLIIWLLFMIVTLISSSELGQSMLKMINDSKLLSFIYENNWISKKIFSVIQ